MEEQFDTPILYLIFNRPELVKQTFPQIKAQRPKQLFIGADGPREGNENDLVKCTECRNWVLAQIDWDCEVMTLFREENLGCGLAVSGAITWFFEHVEMGIILEDDIYAEESFFIFCQEMLTRYKSHNQVMHVTGLNWIHDKVRIDKYSYHFSAYPGIWGWATWADRWKKFDHTLGQLDRYIDSERIKEITGNKLERKYHLETFKGAKNGESHIWDYHWKFCVFNHSGLCIWPAVNLTSNIGFGDNATHTYDKNSWRSNRRIYDLKWPLIYPNRIQRNIRFDKKTADLIFIVKNENISIKIARLMRLIWFSIWPNKNQLTSISRLLEVTKFRFSKRGNHVFIACFPKSGSTFLANSIKEITGFDFVVFVSSYEQNEHDIYEPALIQRYSCNTVTHQHTRATDPNIRILRKHKIKPTILVRNIFDTIVSMRDHIMIETHKWPMAYITPTLFQDFTKREQYDFIIDMIIPWYFNFYTSWITNMAKIDCLVIKHEDMIADPQKTIRNVLEFNDITVKMDDSNISRVIKGVIGSGKDKSRLNKGIAGRGETELSIDQKNRVRSLTHYYKNIDFGLIGL